jgi:tripeptidyl-peptidase-1
MGKGTRYRADFVHPGVALAGNMKKRSIKRIVNPDEQLDTRDVLHNPATAGPCDDLDLITPTCIQHIYNVPKGNKKAPKNSLGIFETGSWYSPTALKSFLANFTDISPDVTLSNITIDISVAHFDRTNDGGEAGLDVQMALPLVYPQNITVYQVDDDYYTTFGTETYRGMVQSWLNAIDAVGVLLPDHRYSRGHSLFNRELG